MAIKTHGMTNTSEYRSWHHMKGRCLNPKDYDYKNYGGRGIDICQDWVDSFESFYKDMGPKPSRNHSLERIDNSKGYNKENCKWATRKEQNNNQRKRRDGVKYTGVYPHWNKYRAVVFPNAKSKHLGLFNTQEEAYEAILKWKKENNT